MARHETEREDLLREATALGRRGEWRVPGEQEPVTAGFREGGECSVYFGQDACYHFDAGGGLRRAYGGGKLYRTQGTTLAELTRVRTPRETQLRRRDLTADEVAEFLTRLRDRLAGLYAAFAGGSAVLLRQVPDDLDPGQELAAWLARRLSGPVKLAAAIKGRR
jgi:hypothetical protein